MNSDARTIHSLVKVVDFDPPVCKGGPLQQLCPAPLNMALGLLLTKWSHIPIMVEVQLANLKNEINNTNQMGVCIQTQMRRGGGIEEVKSARQKGEGVEGGRRKRE